MTQLPNLTNDVATVADNDWFYLYDTSTPGNPDGKISGANLRETLADLSTSAQLTFSTLADTDRFVVWDVSDGDNPRKYILASDIRPPGAKVTRYSGYAGAIVIPAIAAGVETDVTVTVTGAAVGDHLVFNMQDAMPANLIITHSRISAADTALVRFRNVHASTGYAGASLLCTALAIRSA